MTTVQTPVTRETLVLLWDSQPRKVPLAVMLTTAEKEAGIGVGLYDATAVRYEQKSHERAMANPDKWGRYGLAVVDWKSWGVFQMMGFVLREVGYYGIWEQQHEVERRELPVEDYLRVCMRAYDKHMARLIIRHGLPGAFRRYNGSGTAADAYMASANAIWNRLRFAEAGF